MTEYASCLNRLNPRQRKAAAHGVKNGVAKPAEPLLILAGAGSGKTRTLVAHAAYLMASGARPEEMLISSYTRRASNELVAKVRASVLSATGVAVSLPYAGTFHSIAFVLLREYASELGLRNNFTIVDRDDAVTLMDRERTRLGLDQGKKAFPHKDVCLAIHSYATNACLSLKATLDRKFTSHSKLIKPLSKLFQAYKTAKVEQNVLDYDDLLAHFAALLRKPRVRDRLRKRFSYILVDEYQDTNRLQFKILRRLKPDGHGLTVVGDDAQAIYSWRAATVRNIRQFPTRFTRAARIVRLERNYRSVQPILDASNAVIARSKEAFDKQLWSKRASDRKPLLTTVDDEQRQADHVAQTALRLKEEGTPFDQQAVLFRASHQSHALELALKRAKIPFRKWGGRKLLESAHIRDVVAVMQWWHNPRNQLAGFRVLCMLPGVGKTTADRLLTEAGVNPRDRKTFTGVTVSTEASKQLAELMRLFRALKKLKPFWPAAASKIVEWYRPHLERLHPDDGEGRLADLKQFEALAGTFVSCDDLLTQFALDPPPSLADQKLAKDDADDLLTLSTIHSAKGHEWQSVTILSAIEGCLPSSRSKSSDDLEEERRLFYVAMTRAKDRLEIVQPCRLLRSYDKVPVIDFYSKPTRFIARKMRGLFECR